MRITIEYDTRIDNPKCLARLAEAFGAEVTANGYKHVGYGVQSDATGALRYGTVKDGVFEPDEPKAQTQEAREADAKADPTPAEPEDDTKPVRGKNAEALADTLIEDFDKYDSEAWEAQFERLPKKLQEKVQKAIATEDPEPEETEAPEEPEVEDDDILDIDEPEQDNTKVTVEMLKQLAEKLILSQPQGEKQMAVSKMVKDILASVGDADRFARVPEDKLADVYAAMQELSE